MKVNLHTAFKNAQGTEAFEMVKGEKKVHQAFGA